MRIQPKHTFYELFAGGGMARLGLGSAWECSYANDIDSKKASAYRENFGGHELDDRDIADVKSADVPNEADLAWASFPCQDLSLAGTHEGLGHHARKNTTRSGTFWPFWRLIRTLASEKRAPKLVVLENVAGALTSHGGRDFSAIASALSNAGYRYGPLVVDAREFVPQSRPRLFIVAVRSDLPIPPALLRQAPDPHWHTKSVLAGHEAVSRSAQKSWLWWNIPRPNFQPARFSDLIEESPTGVAWHTKAETRRLLEMMTDRNLEKVRAAQRAGRKLVGTIYRRTRPTPDGGKAQRAEVRFDDVSGCLRTPVGGSSRQTILVVEGDSIRSRLLSPREAARLMGLPEDYRLPDRYNDAYHLVGDGVVVPVVRHVAGCILEPILVGLFDVRRSDRSAEKEVTHWPYPNPVPAE